MPPKRSAVAAYIARTLVLVGDVHLQGERVAVGTERDRLLGQLEVDVGDADLRALGGEHDRRLAAHAAAGARDHADLARRAVPIAQPSVEMNTFLISE